MDDDRDWTGPASPDTDACVGCEIMVTRRHALAESTRALATAALVLGLPRSVASVLGASLRAAPAESRRGDTATYPLPADDGATVDRDNAVILVRLKGSVYAFALSCPHQNTALRWDVDAQKFRCPKHHSEYTPDGVFIKGRATRGMDRYAIRREGDKVVVDLATLYQDDEQHDLWAAAVVPA